MKHLTEEEIFEWMDGTLSPELSNVYKNHLDSCMDCKALYKDLKAFELQIKQMPLEKPSVYFTENILEKWELAQIPKVKAPTKLPYIFMILLLVLVGIPILLVTLSEPKEGLVFLKNFDTISTTLKDPQVIKLFLIINTILLLGLFDRAVLRPFFQKRKLSI